ncbi:hypothetical protein TGMAS_208440 [Toxoplasma gondii MAS]|uniref:Microprotein domain-containing protein n=1 Tax=Toxoplasma gondii MAS TaxID=943118 RepID=A0A086QSG7_TOXGO|nr:hypothetical protein TGMAS_208440 [Toxoplasma gondii MAS]
MNTFFLTPAAAAARRVAVSFFARSSASGFPQHRVALRPFPSQRPAERAHNLAKSQTLRSVKAHGRQSGKKQQSTESGGRRGFRAAVGAGTGCMLAASPMLFTDYDNTASPKSELIFMAGNALGYCTERFFENEYGQSIFMFALGLAYLAMLGHEGKIHGAVWRMKHLFATNFKMVGHPRYAYALPKNPLLQDAAPTKTGSTSAKK